MKTSHQNKSVQVSSSRIKDYVPSDAELKIAELARIKSEEAKLNAEAKEITKRINQPWFYKFTSALIHSLIPAVVGTLLVVAFLLQGILDIHSINKELQANIDEKEDKLEKYKESLQNKNTQIQRKQDNLRNVVENLEKDKTPQIKESVSNIQSELNELDKEEVAQLIELLNKPDEAIRRSARNRLAELYPKNPAIVGSVMADAIETNDDNYRITLGILTALGKVEGGWSGSGSLLGTVDSLSQSPHKVDPTFNERLVAAQNNKKSDDSHQ